MYWHRVHTCDYWQLFSKHLPLQECFSHAPLIIVPRCGVNLLDLVLDLPHLCATCQFWSSVALTAVLY